MGGELVSGKQLCLQGFLIFTLFSGIRINNLRGPQLGMAILFAQFAGHFILGGMNNTSPQMALAHVFAGFITYALISNFQDFLLKITRDFFARIFHFYTLNYVIKEFISQFGFLNYTQWSNLFQGVSHRDRGPPFGKYLLS
jgi:hypothetical protein